MNAASDPYSFVQTQPDSSQVPRLTHSAKEKVVRSLVTEQWLTESAGRVGLGPRAYLELKTFLKSYDGMSVCQVCNEAALKVGRPVRI